MLMRFATAALALAISIAANAQQFPTKTVRFISGVTPGAASDTMARLLAEKMTQTLGHPVIVENRLGAGGLVGAKYVADAEPDGHTIMMYASAFTVSTLLNPDVLNPKELQAVATVATIPTVMVTPPGPLVERLHKEITTLVQSPEISAQIRKLGAEPLAMSIAEFDAMIKKELVENTDLIKKANIKAN